MEYLKIKSIKKIQRSEEVYNFSVKKLENYVANGVVAHNCYVHEKQKILGEEEASLEVWQELIEDILWKQKYIKTQQVTLALDALPQNKHKSRMANIAFKYFEMCEKFTDIECHITTNHINDLVKYTEYYDKVELIDLLSISNILSVDQIELARTKAPFAKINWNVTSGDFVKQVKRQGLEAVKNIVRKVDSVYLLLHKAPMGLVGHALNDFFAGLEVLKEFDNVAPEAADGQSCMAPSLSSKFNMDGCMKDARQYLKTGFGCSSNVSRFQIWPDGRVTGCAYNSHNQYGKFGESFQDVLDNLWDAYSRYEFKSCSIPSELKNYSGRKHLQVTT